MNSFIFAEKNVFSTVSTISSNPVDKLFSNSPKSKILNFNVKSWIYKKIYLNPSSRYFGKFHRHLVFFTVNFVDLVSNHTIKMWKNTIKLFEWLINPKWLVLWYSTMIKIKWILAEKKNVEFPFFIRVVDSWV